MKHDSTITVRCNSELKEKIARFADKNFISTSAFLLYAGVKIMGEWEADKCPDDSSSLIRSMEARRLVSTSIEHQCP